MENLPLLQIDLNLSDYKFALFCFISAFSVAAISIPAVIMLVKKYRIYDLPGIRKEHSSPTPTLGGVAIIIGMLSSLLFWHPDPFTKQIVICLASMLLLFGMGVLDDLKDLPAKNKLIVEIGLAAIVALCGIRITSFGGLFGLNILPVSLQYIFTILAIVGVTNAFNLIDGIDGLAGGLSFMSLIILGIFLRMGNDNNFSLVAFALAGGTLAFLYFNMNPAKIFMGDSGSLALGFMIAILCTRLMQVNDAALHPLLKNAPVFTLSLVLIPVFDTIRVFSLRISKGKSPFCADKTHIHHLLTRAGLSHGLTARIIYVVHAFILIQVYLLRDFRPEIILCLLLIAMAIVTIMFYNIYSLRKDTPMETRLKRVG
jgi:UDP-N-acetylmuramyl pentapeptide phosphotransferase/UDP-N-acetylglucosamine-1-phosphate transferase